MMLDSVPKKNPMRSKDTCAGPTKETVLAPIEQQVENSQQNEQIVGVNL